MKAFDFAFAKFRQTEGFDKINDPTKRCFNHGLARSGGRESHYRALPELVIVTLCYRNIKLISDSGLNAFQNAAFAIE